MFNWEFISSAAIFLADAATIIRALLRPHREPAARLAWIIAVLLLPVVGVFLYLLLGEARISSGRRRRGREINARLPRPAGNYDCPHEKVGGAHWAAFALARTVNHLDPTCNNSARLAHDSNAAIDEMIADIDTARETVHGCFYIWLADNNGLKLKDAFIRAAGRRVHVRLLADALGSRRLIRSDHWREMRDAGCEVRVALPVGNPLWTAIRGRVDLRNHRKSMIVDNRIAWCGSQNAADPEFRIKAKYAPWVDIMSRWEGAVAQQCQYLFVSDWIAEGGDEIGDLLTAPTPEGQGAVVAQVLGTGPTAEFDAMPACFSELIHSARDELVVTTPYFIPDEQLLFALTSAARRCVRTVILFPEAERQPDRRRVEPQLLQGPDRRGRRDLRIPPGPPPRQDDGCRLRRRTNRKREPRPPQLRAQFREQYSVRGSGFRHGRPRPTGRISLPVRSRDGRGCGQLQHHLAALAESSLATLSPML